VNETNDLWINVEALPVGGSTNAYAVYSTDGGTNWQNAQMTIDENITDFDGWHVNLGTFAGGTIIEYAVCVQDDNGEVWANNDGNNYSVSVNTAETPSAVEWTPAIPNNCAGSTVNVAYAPDDGTLRNATAVNLVYGFFFESSTNKLYFTLGTT